MHVEEMDTTIEYFTESRLWFAILIVFVLVVVLALLLVCRTKGDDQKLTVRTVESGYCFDMRNVDNLKLVSLLGYGKYGTVWKGVLDQNFVAVKIYPHQNRQYFENERDIYNSYLRNNKSFLTYFGSEERLLEERVEYLMVLSWAEQGCLQEWLKHHTISFDEFCRMALDITDSLSYLHSVAAGESNALKPCISHRDLNTRNILVRADLSCVICDFGFAIKTYGPRYEHRGEIILAETKSISEVGTLRYMAPEILEGAVNLKDCESAFKQIDVYSLGLVLWELATRCHDLYVEQEAVPMYMTPYESEVGKNPTYEQMQFLVARQKARPKFSVNWICGGITAMIKETCEDMWDADSEARLSCHTVKERLQRLYMEHAVSHDTHKTNINSSSNTNLQSISTEAKFRTKKFNFSKPIRKCGGLVQLIRGKRPQKNRVLKSISGCQRKLSQRLKVVNYRTLLYNPNASPSLPGRIKALRPTKLDIIPHVVNPSPDPHSEAAPASIKCSVAKDLTKLDKFIVNPRMTLTHFPEDIQVEYPIHCGSKLVLSRSMKQLEYNAPTNDGILKRQRSLEVFREVFGTRQNTDYLRNPSQRVKTPGDVPPSVRKTRARRTLSLYDDKISWDSDVTTNSI